MEQLLTDSGEIHWVCDYIEIVHYVKFHWVNGLGKPEGTFESAAIVQHLRG